MRNVKTSGSLSTEPVLRGGSVRRRPRRRVEDAAKSLGTVRQVIVGPETERIDVIEGKLTTAENVARVLPEAIGFATENRGEQLAIGLEPAFTTALGNVARAQADLIGEILSPTIGAAVRKAISDFAQAMMQRLDVALEQSLSIRGIRWRLEAARTGRPFAEIALLHSLQYRVEQVLLIHSKTSLVLEHVVAPTVEAPNPDQLAGMLAALDSFGRDALGPLPSSAHLERFDLGELSVWGTHDRWITLAVVVRGTAPAELGDTLRETRERIALEQGQAIRGFDGDVRPFAETRDELTELLRTERRPPVRRGKMLLFCLAIIALAVAAVLTARSVVRSERDRASLAAYRGALEGEPGIVLRSATWKDGRGVFTGLRDPLAAQPADVLRRHGLSPAPASIDVAPFLSDAPSIERRRAERVLEPPPGVELDVANGRLIARGVAPRAWIEEARLLGRTLPMLAYDDGALVSSESVAALRAAEESLVRVEVPFAPGVDRVGPEQQRHLARAAEAANAVLEKAGAAHAEACIGVVGHADPTGTEARNRELGAARAEAVAASLASLGIPRAALRARGSEQVGAPDARRVVTFESSSCEARP